MTLKSISFQPWKLGRGGAAHPFGESHPAFPSSCCRPARATRGACRASGMFPALPFLSRSRATSFPGFCTSEGKPIRRSWAGTALKKREENGKTGNNPAGGVGNSGIVPGLSHSGPSQPLWPGMTFGNGSKSRLAQRKVELEQPERVQIPL